MSYILEALRRAERERHLGQTPSVDALNPVSPARRGPALRLPPLRLLLATASALLLLAAAGVLWKRMPATPPPETAVPVASVAAPAPVANPSTPAAATPAAPAEPELPAIENGAVMSLDDVEAPFGSAEAPGPVIDDSAPVDAAPEMPAPTARAPARRPVVAAPEAPLLKDMSPAYRAQFPAFGLDVHVYDEDAARRWIMVGGRRYREGDALAAGPRIIEILAEGVIYEHGGQRVLLPLAR